MPTIAVATDFSTRSDRALTRASMLAKAHGAELLLIHVIDDDQPVSVIEAHRTEASKLLANLDRSMRELTGVASRSEILLGDPFARITSAAAEANVGLLVMGAHRRQLLRDQFRGTTVERAIRRSRVPVLVANAVPAGAYEKVLLATDLSDQSGHALEHAVSLTFLEGSRFSLVYVFEPLARRALGRALVSRNEIADYVADEHAQAMARLRAFAEEWRLEGLRLFAHDLRRSIERDVLDMAGEQDARLVVVGSGQKGLLEALMLGSVAEGVLRDSERDVLVIPNTATEARVPPETETA
jgi:nucleotide-binding universal stress UspA family protein